MLRNSGGQAKHMHGWGRAERTPESLGEARRGADVSDFASIETRLGEVGLASAGMAGQLKPSLVALLVRHPPLNKTIPKCMLGVQIP